MGLDLLNSIIENPIPFAHSLGYDKLNNEIHKEWIRTMFKLDHNGTLQAHRGSYKTTCLIIALVLWVIAKPYENIIFIRKSQEDVKDVLNAVSKLLQKDETMFLMNDVYGFYPKMTIDNSTELELSTYKGTMGRQVLGLGLKASITGKHGSVITDDIVTLKDRVSGAERKATISQYMELANIASESEHRIYNTGTPWHKDDAFKIMPKPQMFTVYQTGIISKDRIQERKDAMTSSLFSANYELKHISDEDLLFKEPQYGEFPIGGKAYAHIDAAYGGPDSSAMTIISEVGGKLHTIGWKMPGHIETRYTEICSRLERYQVLACYCEDNADKGFLRKELGARTRTMIGGYHESMNKYYKISTFGKSRWNDVIFDMVDGDIEYISDIMEYNENSAHDDCPDSFASLVRKQFKTGNMISYHGG